MTNILLRTLLCLASLSLFAQEVYVAPFRHDAQGAYTLIHDDFGASYARGIEEYVDTMTYNRGLPICFAAITGECDAQDWKKANEMIAHGHQILNHTMSHKCGIPQDWCTFGDWDEHDFPVEIDKSTELILKHTGKHPSFFVFPFDLITDTMIAYLKHIHYFGARGGVENKLNAATLKDPFRLSFHVLRPEHPLSNLNDLAQQATTQKSWGIRVMHGIEDESWGKRTWEEYADHVNYLKQQVKENKLWMATLSEVASYQYMKKTVDALEVKSRSANGLPTKLSFHVVAPIVSFKYYLFFITNKTLTVVLTTNGTLPKAIVQQNQNLPFEVHGDKIAFDAQAGYDDITITY